MTELRFFLLSITPPGPAEVRDLGTEPAAALDVFREVERRTAFNGTKVVLLSAASEAVLRSTHSSYFGVELPAL